MGNILLFKGLTRPRSFETAEQYAIYLKLEKEAYNYAKRTRGEFDSNFFVYDWLARFWEKDRGD